VEVTRRDTGHRVVVRINDRGPFVRGRILDLSRGAARRLDAIGPGVVPVRLRVMAIPGAGGVPGAYTVQLGHFRDPDRARQLLDRLGPVIPGLRLVPGGAEGGVRVCTRAYGNYDHAVRVASRIRRDLQPDAFVVREDRILTQ